MKICDACGKKVSGGADIDSVLICKDCAVDIREEINNLKTKGKTVNVKHIARKLFKAEHSAGNYLLRDIPDELWKSLNPFFHKAHSFVKIYVDNNHDIDATSQSFFP